ncbi:MAG TPA: tetratricopeptide repeat protein [Bdellovibrionota bacterium]|nr:tetratricopeptide repeat protein [Bdellovibrionota bacterium]
MPNDELGYAWTSRLAGGLYNYLGNYKKARKLLENCLRNYTAWYGEKHIKLLEILSHLTKTYVGLKNYKEAIKCFEQYQEIFRTTTFEVKHYTTPIAYAHLKDYHKAIEEQMRELHFARSYYGPCHVAIGIIMNDLGHCYLLEGNYKETEKWLKQAQEIFYKNEHPQVYETLELLARIKLKEAESVSGDDLIKNGNDAYIVGGVI